MNGPELDTQLATALCHMAESNWPASHTVLAERLGQAGALGNLRLNLFLLSVAAASDGHQQSANDLWTRAQNAPLDSNTTRYLDLQLGPQDPRHSVLIDLERAWWDFNNWNQTTTPVLAMEMDDGVDWDFVLKSTLAGEYYELESRYSQNLQQQDEESPYLWNLFALAYLQAGDVRTHNEMYGNKPPLPNRVPEELKRTLNAQNLGAAIQSFEAGQWLTQDGLMGSGATLSFERETLDLAAWREQMQNGFALIDLGQFEAATRVFETLIGATEDRRLSVLALNALALGFFKLGDYTQTESILAEFHNLAADFPVAPDSDLGRLFAGWLTSVDAAPESGLFFRPFKSRPAWTQDHSEEALLDFEELLTSCVNHLGDGETGQVSRQLQHLETSQTQLEPNQQYLVSLLYLLTAVSQADHMAVQDFETELESKRLQTSFTEDRLMELSDTFKWAGFEHLGKRLQQSEQGCPPRLDPWTDLARSETASSLESVPSFEEL